jgi:spermidine/putrescine transport system substrate-binding protein
VIVPTQDYVKIMGDQGLLYHLDTKLLPNLKYVSKAFLDRPYDPGNRYSIPKDYGVTGFGYRTDVVTEQPKTWADFYELMPKYSKKNVNWLEGPAQNVDMALASLGPDTDINTDDDALLDKAKKILLKAKPHVNTISTQYIDRFSNGDLNISMGWNGDFARIIANRKKQGDTVFILPDGRSEFWVDNWAILADAPHPVAAHAWINFVLSPDATARDWNYVQYSFPNQAALQAGVLPSIRKDPIIAVAPSIIQRYQNIITSAAGTQKRAQIWTEVLAA